MINTLVVCVDVKQPSILDSLSKPAAAKKSTATKPATFSDSENSPAPAAKKAAVRKRKVAVSSDDSGSDSDGGNLMARLKGKAAAAGKVRFHSMKLYVTAVPIFSLA